MDFRHTDEQLAWKDMLTASWRKRSGREYTREHDENRQFPDEVYRKAADNGWLGMLVPEEHGGVAADPVMYAIFCEAIAKFSLDTAACLMTSMFTVSNIVYHGTPEQQAEHIPAFLRASAGSRSRSPSPGGFGRGGHLDQGGARTATTGSSTATRPGAPAPTCPATGSS